jgi:hypothetical protein
VRRLLENDVDYLQAVGNIYNGLGQPHEAMIFLNRVQQHYAMEHSAPPADIDIQNAYLLFNGNNDTGLYRQLMGSGQPARSHQRPAPHGPDHLVALGRAPRESGRRRRQQ